MMKFALAFVATLAVLGSSSAYQIPNVGTGELAREIQDFLDIIPQDEIMSITLQYLAEDAEFQQAVAYMQSPEFGQLAREVEALPEVKNLMAYIYNAGIDIYSMVNGFNQFIGIEPVVPFAGVRPEITGGVSGFIADVKAILPMDQLDEMYKNKLRDSIVFASFIGRLESPEFQYIVDTVYAIPSFQELLNKARMAGIDLQALRQLLEVIFGIRVPA